VSAILEGDRVVIAWSGNVETNVTTYQIYRSTSSPVAIDSQNLLIEVPHIGEGSLYEYEDFDVSVSETTEFHYVVTAIDLDADKSLPSNEVAATVTIAGQEVLDILSATYATKPRKFEVIVTSTLAGETTLTIFGGPDEASIDWQNPLVEAMDYDFASNQHEVNIRISNAPTWIGVTSSGGGNPVTMKVTVR
jgi:hypothetical protein